LHAETVITTFGAGFGHAGRGASRTGALGEAEPALADLP
jgi:hypothetical protein